MLTLANQPCSRRGMLEAAGAGLFGLSLPRLLAAETAAAGKARAKSVIFLSLFGGPSQLETFDLKPSAPSKIRGPFQPTACRTSGLVISDQLPKLAATSDKFCFIRSMTHPYNDHSGGAHYIQTGKQWPIPIGGGFNATAGDWPAIGSVVEYLAQNRPALLPARATAGSLPNYVVAPNFLGRLQEYSTQLRRPGEYAGWLGRGYDPLTTAIDKRDKKDNPYFRDCTDDELNYQIQGLALPAEITLARVAQRQSLLAQFDEQLRAAEGSPALAALDKFQARAFTLATAPQTRRALDIRQEPAALRDRYGRNLFGQSVLLARRLVEAGSTFVTVHFGGWDHHWDLKAGYESALPRVDAAVAALFEDLSDRGLLDTTLVVLCGEFGRTPKMNDGGNGGPPMSKGTPGRDHWGNAMFCLLGGGGVRGGQVVGSTDRLGQRPHTRAVTPSNIHATIYHVLGIDPKLQLLDPSGRPVNVLDDPEPITELL
jgi:uncharacterized protein (DUF1501 family)